MTQTNYEAYEECWDTGIYCDLPCDGCPYCYECSGNEHSDEEFGNDEYDGD